MTTTYSLQNKTLPAFNPADKPLAFRTKKELLDFAQLNSINERRPFYFTLKGEYVVFNCLYEFFYEG